MKKLLSIFISALFAAAVLPSAANAVVIDPASGRSGNFFFTGVGSPGVFDATSTTATVDLATAGTIDVSLTDCCLYGDAFDLLLNGSVVKSTTVAFPGGVGGHFSAFFDDILLSAGLNTFSIMVTASCCSTGGGAYEFSAVTPAVIADVPEPAAISLLGLGLLGMSAMRRRKAV